MNPKFFIKTFALVLLISLSFRQNYYQTKEIERNEILKIVKNFKQVNHISTSSPKKNCAYLISFDSLVSNRYFDTQEFDSVLLRIEGIENASSKLYLDDFVNSISYYQEEDYIYMRFDDPSGAFFKDGKWEETDFSFSWDIF